MWIRRVLNDRLYELPPGVSLLVREGVRRASARGGLTWTSGECAAVVGARALLAEHSEQSGIVKLADASCHWWILRETRRVRTRRPEAREWVATGYCGLLHHGEILEHAVGLQGAQRLGGMFKIRLGSQRVVVLVEPDDPTKVTQDVARIALQFDGGPLPWERWGLQFAAQLPEPILELQRALMDRLGGEPRRSAVTARWRRVSKPIVARLQITRRPAARDPADTAARRPRPADKVRSRDGDSHAAAPGHLGHAAPELAARAPDSGEAGRSRRPKHPARAREVTLSYPQTLWLAEGWHPRTCTTRPPAMTHATTC